MSDTPTLTGQDIGQAEKATRALLDGLLAETGTTFHPTQERRSDRTQAFRGKEWLLSNQ